mmetsp:Transcript_11388/g.28046  ORF Transcript_11388/g.28046 Transcript_11388/m.28046 type:complete len:230 (-) Transcript_11388:1444-2133(-)
MAQNAPARRPLSSSQIEGGCKYNVPLQLRDALLELCLELRVPDKLCRRGHLPQKFLQPPYATDDGPLEYVRELADVGELCPFHPRVDDVHQRRFELLLVLLDVDLEPCVLDDLRHPRHAPLKITQGLLQLVFEVHNVVRPFLENEAAKHGHDLLRREIVEHVAQNDFRDHQFVARTDFTGHAAFEGDHIIRSRVSQPSEHPGHPLQSFFELNILHAAGQLRLGFFHLLF